MTNNTVDLSSTLLIENIPELRIQLKKLTGVDILQADGITFKNTYQILKELSEVWDDLTKNNIND